MIILKVAKNQGFTLSLEDTFSKDSGGQIDFPVVLGLSINSLPENLVVALRNILCSLFSKINIFCNLL